MRTVHCCGHLGEGRVCPADVCPEGDVCPRGCLPGDGGCMPLPPPWTEFLTLACENITFPPQLLLRTVIIMNALTLQKISRTCHVIDLWRNKMSSLCLVNTGMDALIEVLLGSGLIACWLYFIAGTSEKLLRSISLQRQLPSGHLVAWALWALIHRQWACS